ncbi:sensor histidine kinase [Georgenia sp. SYP-B2076]|uniref:sensor histidine kinase n=1 Tax=Georgenia sp. SYP-B2076 TaxID=2495881 RepID=UPI000F8C6137|nr:histidine kinase [Georgenia sp. SYP-B2076]
MADVGRSGVRPGDVLLAGALALFAAGGTVPAGLNQPEALPPDVIAYVLTTLAAAALVLWRVAPAGVFATVAVVLGAYLALGYPYGPIMITGAVAAGLMASARPLRTAVVAGGAAVVVLALAVLFRTVLAPTAPGAVSVQLLGVLVWTALPLAIGVTVRTRRDAAARVRAEQALRVVSEERLRMAQEVHDVVGHGLAVIALQAGAGLHVLDHDPARARAALEAIRDTSRESLDGLRAELASLRGDAARRPALGLDDLEALVGRVRAGGLDVRLDLARPDPEVAPAVGDAAYRIVQEALTNVLRHAGAGAAAVVRVHPARGRLLVEVADTGAGPPPGGLAPGSGVAGMRARAERAGGTLEVAGRPGGGVRVRARLPLAGPLSRPPLAGDAP